MRLTILAGIILLFSGCTGASSGGSGAGGNGKRTGSDGNTPVNTTGATPGPSATPFILQLHAPGCTPWAPVPELSGNVTFTPVFSSLGPYIGEPVALGQPPADGSIWYMIELYGRLSSFPNNATSLDPNLRLTVLDMTNEVYAENEAGMLSMAIDPNFATNRRIYLSYTTNNNNTINSSDAYILNVARLTVGNDGTATSSAPDVVFQVPEPYNFHIGGHIVFGPDGYLYIGTGMADTSNNPSGTAQNLQSPYGKILRIDVSQNHNGTFGNYAIPSSNPFVGNNAVLPEIFAYGFRNPWQFNFDHGTGALWVGDVGENLWEEIDHVTPAGNYGWSDFEGPICNPNSAANHSNNDAGCAALASTAIFPRFAYAHDGSTNAYGDCVVAGTVYRGTNVPNLDGAEVFSDCITGTIWALLPDPNGNPNVFTTLGQPDAGILSFGQDDEGELYFVDRLGDFTRIDPESSNSNVSLPTTLTATGCFNDANSMLPVPGVIPYTVSVSFWSDGADKTRFVSIPEGSTMSIDANSHITLPIGTILVKNFSVAGQQVETRIYARQSDGAWTPYSYAWQNGTTSLVPATGMDVVLNNNVTWHYPSQEQCLECHNPAAGYNLGWQVGQLDTMLDYGDGVPVNQLEAYSKWGLLSGDIPSNASAFISPADTNQSLDARARTYLHVNCAMCHQPGGQGLGTLDLRITTPASELGMCNVTPSFGNFSVANAALLVPGNHAESLLSFRMHATNAARMPPVSSDVVDVQGTGLVDAWIDSLTACPQ